MPRGAAFLQFPCKPAPFINAGIPMNNKYKILLVEDEPSIRKYVNALLNASGYIVIEAANCAEAKPCFLFHTRPTLFFLTSGCPTGTECSCLSSSAAVLPCP